MAHTVHTGWRAVTPGACPDCGMDSDYGCDGRGNVACSCSDSFDESYDTTEHAPAKAEYHYTIGGGSVGCLYDFGPETAATLDEALDALDQIYGLTTAERNQLRWHKHLAFDTTPGSAVDIEFPEGDAAESRRSQAGADYCEIVEQAGPCPESDE